MSTENQNQLTAAACGQVMSFDDECVLHFATRYALGRKTTAVGIVCRVLKREWSRLRPGTGEQIQREVSEAINDGRAGDLCDVVEWRDILKQPNDEMRDRLGAKEL